MQKYTIQYSQPPTKELMEGMILNKNGQACLGFTFSLDRTPLFISVIPDVKERLDAATASSIKKRLKLIYAHLCGLNDIWA